MACCVIIDAVVVLRPGVIISSLILLCLAVVRHEALDVLGAQASACKRHWH